MCLLALRPGNSLTALSAALSLDSSSSVSFPTPNLATGFLLLSLAGLSPAEHTSLCWTYNRPLVTSLVTCYHLLHKEALKPIGVYRASDFFLKFFMTLAFCDIFFLSDGIYADSLLSYTFHSESCNGGDVLDWVPALALGLA